MKIISWNVNGIESTYKKGLIDFIKEEDADIVCLQETKGSPDTVNDDIMNLDDYNVFWNRAERKGYSGVLTYSKFKPIKRMDGIKFEKTDNEGRILTLEFEKYYLINAYFVNAARDLSRLDLKIEFNEKLLEFANNLKESKPVIITGDFNVAHKEIDIKNPKSNEKNAGFTKEEREWFTKLLDNGYVDTFRMFNKKDGNYTWWSYRYNARQKNIGWRLDYFVVSKDFKDNVEKSEILSEIQGSDHCPIRLIISI